MCGIVGIINPTKRYAMKLTDLITDMLAMDTIRGEDSTGLFKVVDKKVEWIKDIVPGYEFVKDVEVHKFLTGIGNASFVVGHNRWATRGTVSLANAHPFEYEHICLVHNGTVVKNDKLDASKKKHDVDSAVITKSIATQGIQATTNALWGAYALVWYDATKETLCFLRNKDRPMWFLHTKQGIILFCSEPHLGQWAAVRRGFDVINVESTKEDTLYTFDSKQDFDVPIEEPMKAEVQHFLPPIRHESVDWGFNVEKLKNLLKMFRVGDTFKFSLNDFDEYQKQGNFIRVFGESPHNNLISCVGNYSGQIEPLYSTKTLLKGTIASLGISKKLKKVVLSLKDISITEEPDPFFVQVVPVEPAKPRLSIVSSKSCALCSHVFTRINCDDPYLITDVEGIQKIVCVSCKMDRPNPNDDLTDKEVRSWH